MQEIANKISFAYENIDEAFPACDPGVTPFGSRVLVQIRTPKKKTAAPAKASKAVVKPARVKASSARSAPKKTAPAKATPKKRGRPVGSGKKAANTVSN